MVRIISFLVGLAFAGVLLISLFVGVANYVGSPPAATAEEEYHLAPGHVSFPSDGLLGHFNKQQLQRGFQVYKEVCSACHSLSLVHFRDLRALGYTEAEVKAIANQWQSEVPSINPETGEASTRKATPPDAFPSPYPNETAARAANNIALPPDLSLITKARHGGAQYVHSLLTGFRQQPAELVKKFPATKTPPNLHYNPYFANLNIAMPPPLVSEGQVQYADGTKPTVDQMAQDVSEFLVWTAEPNLERRHAAGLAVIVFLLFGSILGYLAYQNVWAEAKRKVAPVGPLDPVNKAKRTRASRNAGVTP
jgi:ubiquinol-cytochrome c reductase cytochrome c1 subunit